MLPIRSLFPGIVAIFTLAGFLSVPSDSAAEPGPTPAPAPSRIRVPGFVVPLVAATPARTPASSPIAVAPRPTPRTDSTRSATATTPKPSPTRTPAPQAAPSATIIPARRLAEIPSVPTPTRATPTPQPPRQVASVADRTPAFTPAPVLRSTPTPAPTLPAVTPKPTPSPDPTPPTRSWFSMPGMISPDTPVSVLANRPQTQPVLLASNASITDWKNAPLSAQNGDLARVASAAAARQTNAWESAGISKPATDLVVLPREICFSGKTVMLRAGAAQGLQRLLAAAARDGIELTVVSGYRDYAHQVRLYRQAVSRYGSGQKMVAKPGRSEHHMGNTVDFADGRGRHVLRQSFGQSPEGRWLRKNGPAHGWHLTVSYEPWHARYIGSKSSSRLNPLNLFRPAAQ